MTLTWAATLRTVLSTWPPDVVDLLVTGSDRYRRATLPDEFRLRGVGSTSVGVALLSERVGELAAQPLVVLGEYPVAVEGGVQPGCADAWEVRWLVGTGAEGAGRVTARSRSISARISGWA